MTFWRWLMCELFHPRERIDDVLGRCKHPRCGRLVFIEQPR